MHKIKSVYKNHFVLLVTMAIAIFGYGNNINDDLQAAIFYLKNNKGMSVAITNYGARIVSITLPDKNKKNTEVIVGFNTVDEYKNAKGRSYGATIGRYANRIANGRFTLDGITYDLPKNNNGNTIHGGPSGFNEQVWQVGKVSKKAVEFTYLSKDGEQGFPGNLWVKVEYALNNNNELSIQYTATTDKKTVINFTNHSYFNLNGGGDITNHIVSINAAYFTPVNQMLLPTGEIRKVDNTPFDLRSSVKISDKINENNEQLQFASGYDHNFVLNKTASKKPQLAATAYSDITGIEMKTYTQEPGMQFFTGNSLKGLDKDRFGASIAFRTGLCFETQHFPDAPNHPNFSSTVLSPHKKYNSLTIYKFSVR